jgi:glyoxylate carboligase
MNNMPIYEALAQAFAAEGVDTHFTLMGDGNMHWATAMKNLDGMASYWVRHEHCACATAMGYHNATGKVGVASVTCVAICRGSNGGDSNIGRPLSNTPDSIALLCRGVELAAGLRMTITSKTRP